MAAHLSLEVTTMNRHAVIGLDGHGDDARANDNDPTLSARRVQAVRGALISAGIAAERISAGAFGARQPVCRDATDACLALKPARGDSRNEPVTPT
jgi:outer membrane protein OmpA-like peptidoglycan-associated protein